MQTLEKRDEHPRGRPEVDLGAHFTGFPRSLKRRGDSPLQVAEASLHDLGGLPVAGEQFRRRVAEQAAPAPTVGRRTQGAEQDGPQAREDRAVAL